jgi:NAD(P)H-dependent FMN reductase
MITVIAGTNARNSNTAKVASVQYAYLKSQGVDCQLLNLAEMPTDFLSSAMYEQPAASFVAFQEKYLLPAEKFVIAIPEYNGGVPGIFKLMIDASDIKNAWWGKKASLTGVASGRSGNLRGLDHLTNMLHYLKMDVMKNKIPVSQIHSLLDENGNFTHQPTIDLLHEQMRQFIEF